MKTTTTNRRPVTDLANFSVNWDDAMREGRRLQAETVGAALAAGWTAMVAFLGRVAQAISARVGGVGSRSDVGGGRGAAY